METEYEYGIAKRNDGLFYIFRNKRNSNIYEYLHDIRIRLSTTDNQPFLPGWGSIDRAWTSYKGMPKISIVNLLNKAIQRDIEFQQRNTATQIKERMSIDEFLKNED
jgi:hypothetical protein